MKRLFIALQGLLVLELLLSQNALAQLRPLEVEEAECGPMVRPDALAPMDYRTDRKLLSTVEWGHFRPNVENLTKPMFQYFGSDLSYTLHGYPNHPRALLTLIRLGEKENSEQPKGLPYTIDCFFRRALRWRSDDLVVRMIYAQYLIKKERNTDARAQLEYVVNLAGDNPFTHFNAGLLYFDLKDYDKALQQAHRAEQLGFERQDLKTKLTQAGHWRDPVAAVGSAAASAPGAAQ